MTRWIAVDWGTTRLRATLMEGETPGETRTSDDGMVGSRQGWVEAPYATVPATPLSADLVRPDAVDNRVRVWIVPGLKQTDPADVMRGEETQIAGFLADADDFDGVICLPGTHTKWVQVSAGEVVSFRTAMTGDLFAAIAGHTVLRHSVGGDGWDDDAFATAVSDALSRPEALAVRLFGLRAEALLADLGPAAARARLSGLLIGAELAALKPYWLGQPVALIGAPALCAHYAAALDLQGVACRRVDPETATLSGLIAARRLLQGA